MERLPKVTAAEETASAGEGGRSSPLPASSGGASAPRFVAEHVSPAVSGFAEKSIRYELVSGTALITVPRALSLVIMVSRGITGAFLGLELISGGGWATLRSCLA